MSVEQAYSKLTYVHTVQSEKEWDIWTVLCITTF